jgi:enoyl-CoA hydratase/carnithine racemase
LTRAAATNQQIKEAEMSEIVTQHFENILRIQFNRPEKKNAMTSNMYSTVAELLNAAAKDDETRVVLLLTHFDFVYAAEHTRFQMPFVNLALVPELGTSYWLPAQIGFTAFFEKRKPDFTKFKATA